MGTKKRIRIVIDFMMTVILLLLMAYQITGQELHEWFGAGMLLIFIIHNILNRKWYGGLFKGKYKCFRIFQTIVNFATLISMLCLGYSGVIMSGYVFKPLNISGSLVISRNMHMAAAYWGFVLMSIHLGMHWGQILGIFKKILKKTNMILMWALRFAAVTIAVYGQRCFIKNNIISYMFLKNHFVFFDFEQFTLSVFAEYIAMMSLWIFIGYYITKLIFLKSVKVLK